MVFKRFDGARVRGRLPFASRRANGGNNNVFNIIQAKLKKLDLTYDLCKSVLKLSRQKN